MPNAKGIPGVIPVGLVLIAILACGLIDFPAATPTGGQTANPTATSAVNPDCTSPLDEETLSRLTFSLGALFGDRDLLAGGTYEITLGVVECCYIYLPVVACATWSVEPADGVQIDPATGALEVSPDVPGGSEFTVSADIEDGRRVISETVYVYTTETHPLVRIWSETAQLVCEDGSEIVPDELMSELVFRADGQFTATWHPFEVYVDYWGTYAFDLQTHTLTLEIEDGNYIPADLDGEGTFRFDENGRLILEGIWLGSPPSGLLEGRCGHIFG